MATPESQVIVAPATPPGPAPRAVLRLSGPDLLAQARTFLPQGCPDLEARRGSVRTHLEVFPGAPLQVDLLCFPGPGSATGEDVLEIHLPGSPPLVEALLRSTLDRGARLAQPGEFTRRAFLHGRLDLTQAEAVLELVESRSSGAARAAARLLAGDLGPALQESRDVLLAALVELEASLDFEEGDSQDLQPGEVGTLLTQAIATLQRSLRGEERRRVRHGGQFRVGLLGPPNAGKTSLFRTLTGTPGLVSAQAGTTRDRREASATLSGIDLPVTLVDAPGLGGVAVDARDAAARRLAEEVEPSLDLLWFCLRPDTVPEDLPQRLPDLPCLLLWTQADREPGPPRAGLRRALAALLGPVEEVVVGHHGGHGQEALEQATAALFRAHEQAHAESLRHSERHQEALDAALEALRRGQDWDAQGGHQDLVAEEIRSALQSLAELVGETTPEAVLDRLFSSFCVGK